MKTDLGALVGPPPLADGDIYKVPYERQLVMAVDALLDMSRQAGHSKTVETEKHWELVEKIAELWATLYPEQWHEYKAMQTRQKLAQKNKTASNKEGEAHIQHQLEIPRKFYELMMAVFPLQKFDKKFAAKFARRMPLMRIPDHL